MPIDRKYREQIRRAKAKLNGRVSETKAGVALYAITKICERTPVLTGLAVGNWNLSVGAPDTTKRRPAKSRRPPIERAKRVLGSIRRGIGEKNQVFITNIIPYVKFLEYGTSRQAPKGMVRLTLAELSAQARKYFVTKIS